MLASFAGLFLRLLIKLVHQFVLGPNAIPSLSRNRLHFVYDFQEHASIVVPLPVKGDHFLGDVVRHSFSLLLP